MSRSERADEQRRAAKAAAEAASREKTQPQRMSRRTFLVAVGLLGPPAIVATLQAARVIDIFPNPAPSAIPPPPSPEDPHPTDQTIAEIPFAINRATAETAQAFCKVVDCKGHDLVSMVKVVDKADFLQAAATLAGLDKPDEKIVADLGSGDTVAFTPIDRSQIFICEQFLDQKAQELSQIQFPSKYSTTELLLHEVLFHEFIHAVLEAPASNVTPLPSPQTLVNPQTGQKVVFTEARGITIYGQVSTTNQEVVLHGSRETLVELAAQVLLKQAQLSFIAGAYATTTDITASLFTLSNIPESDIPKFVSGERSLRELWAAWGNLLNKENMTDPNLIAARGAFAYNLIGQATDGYTSEENVEQFLLNLISPPSPRQ